MKALIVLVLSMTLNAFAGDLYFICSTNYGATEQDEYFLINKTINQNEIINGHFHEPGNIDHMIDVNLDTKTRQLSVYCSDIHSGNDCGSLKANLEINREVFVTKNVSCRIAD